jgi:hypothetical protein
MGAAMIPGGGKALNDSLDLPRETAYDNLHPA